MDDLSQAQLQQLLAKEGTGLCDDPQRCEGLLKDNFPQHPKQVSLLVSALKHQVPNELLASRNKVPPEVVRSRLVQKLTENYIQPEAAQWAVDSWATALGLPLTSANPNPPQTYQPPLNQQQTPGAGRETQFAEPSRNTPAQQQNTEVVDIKALRQQLASQTPVSPGQTPLSWAGVSDQSQGKPKRNLLLLVPLLAGLVLLPLGGWWLFQQLIGTRNNLSAPIGSTGGSTGSTSGGRFPAEFKDVAGVPQATVNYGGSTTWAQIRGFVDPEISKVFPGFRLRYVEPVGRNPGSGTGIEMLTEGQLSVAQSSRALKDKEIKAAETRGFKLLQTAVAIDTIVMVAHLDLKLPGLTVEQLRDIYTGKVTNWKQVGGSDLAITAFSRDPKAGGTVDFFLEHVLGKDVKLGRNVQIVRDTTDGLRRTAASPGGVYYGSAPEVIGQCKVKPLVLADKAGKFIAPYQGPLVPAQDCPGKRNQLNATAIRDGSYPITRNLFVIIKQDGKLDQQVGTAYADLLLSDQGQKLLNQAGFVSLR